MKKTDYKKLYNKVKRENTVLFNDKVALVNQVQSQAQLIRDLYSGKVKIKKEEK